MQRWLALCLTFLLLLAPLSVKADFTFSDYEFQGIFTTQNLDAIITKYELFDGWYWTTPADTPQTFHGQAECPGWTETAVMEWERTEYVNGWFGCRWGVEQFSRWSPNRGGYGECFGFAQMIGYLLSGDVNPQGHWNKYYSVEKSEGFRVGDIVRVEYESDDHPYHHSAVVYAVYGEEVTFLQVSSSDYNRISVDAPFSIGYYQDLNCVSDFENLPHLKISRYVEDVGD